MCEYMKSFDEQRMIDSLRFEEQRLAGELVALKRQILEKLRLTARRSCRRRRSASRSTRVNQNVQYNVHWLQETLGINVSRAVVEQDHSL